MSFRRAHHTKERERTYDPQRQRRIDVVKENWNKRFPMIQHKYPEAIGESIAGTIFYPDLRKVKSPLLDTNPTDLLEVKTESLVRPYKTVIKITEEDTLDAGWDMHTQGLNPLILNMASDKFPGGGYLKGSLAQEEELFRRTTLEMALAPQLYHYPLKLYQGFYTPKVCVFRGGIAEDYEVYKWKDCYWASFVTVAALRNPSLEHHHFQPRDKAVTLEKIRSLFNIGLEQGHDALLLSAMGCGAFHNPPDDVAALFKQVCQEYENYFKEIRFGIYDQYGTNISAFRKAFA